MNGKTKERLFVKEPHVLYFMDFIERLDKIPDTSSKVSFLKKSLYSFEGRKPEFVILNAYFIHRLLFGNRPKAKVLPLDNDKPEKESWSRFHIVVFDFMVNWGLDREFFRPYVEDYIYAESGVLQDFMCKFANMDNIYKIPKAELHGVWENKKIGLVKSVYIDIKFLDENFIGYRKEHIINKKDRNEIFGEHPLVYTSRKHKYLTDKKKVTECIERNLKARKEWLHLKETNGFVKNLDIRFPAIVFPTKSNKRKLYYFVTFRGVVDTNMEGLLRQQFEAITGSIKRFVFIGHLIDESTMDVLVMCDTQSVCQTFMENRAYFYNTTPTTMMNAFKRLKKKAEYFEENYKIRTIRMCPLKGIPLMSLHHLLNYMLLNKYQFQNYPSTVMFRNFLITSSSVIIRKVIITDYDIHKKLMSVTRLDNKEDIKIHFYRVSESKEVFHNFLNKEVLLFRFEMGGDFLLLAPLKKFTFLEEEMADKYVRLLNK